MVANSKQKLKLLYVYRMLMEQTDAERGLTMTQILQNLADEGIQAERKSIYNDIKALREFGLEITTYPRNPVEYALVQGRPRLAELMLLIDAVQSSKFLTDAKSKQLVKMLRGMASSRERDLLAKRVHVDGRIKSQNDSVFYNVDTIHNAMRLKRKVEFMYFKYGCDLERHPTREALYVHTPVKLVYTDGFYYLVVWSDEREGFLTFRVDRMQLLQVSDEKATRNEQIAKYALEDFDYKIFGMYDGAHESITLHVSNPVGMDVLVDRFGREAITVTGASEDGCQCDAHVRVVSSPQFYGWLAGVGDIIQLAGPARVVEGYKAWISGLMDR